MPPIPFAPCGLYTFFVPITFEEVIAKIPSIGFVTSGKVTAAEVLADIQDVTDKLKTLPNRYDGTGRFGDKR